MAIAYPNMCQAKMETAKYMNPITIPRKLNPNLKNGFEHTYSGFYHFLKFPEFE